MDEKFHRFALRGELLGRERERDGENEREREGVRERTREREREREKQCGNYRVFCKGSA